MTEAALALDPVLTADINRVLDAPTDRFTDLVRLAGLRPDRDFRDINLQGITLEDEDLTAHGQGSVPFDFSGTDLRGARLVRVNLPANTLAVADFQGAYFEDACLEGEPVAPEQMPDFASFREMKGGPEMVVIPGGTFLMGSPEDEEGRDDDEGPQHGVTVPRFAMGRFAVTFEEYDAFCEETGRERPGDEDWGRGRRPVIHVSWDDAKAYCAWASDRTGAAYRLPSEAEWEYACRAGTTTPFFFGETISTDQANYDGTFTYGNGRTGEDRQQTTPVGTFPANAFGLHDMHGNVREWCEDPWHDSYVGAPADGSAWVVNSTESNARVVRGGSWFSDPITLRSADRSGYGPDGRNFTIGLRVARTL